MKKAIHILKDNRGSGYIDLVVLIIVMSLAMMLILKVTPIFLIKRDLGEAANYISRVISVEGCYDTEVKEKITEYLTKNQFLGFTIDLSDTNYIHGTEKVQLSDTVTVTVRTVYNISFWKFNVLPIPLANRSIGRSEVYWKE